MKRLILLTLLLGTPSFAADLQVADEARRSDERILLTMHRAVLQAHLDNDVTAWESLESDDYVVVNRGEITWPTRDERRSMRTAYLGATRFTVYRDLVEPIVNISDDATRAWLIAQVEAKGMQGDRPLEFVSAWIELYEKRDGRWVMVGNVSNFR